MSMFVIATFVLLALILLTGIAFIIYFGVTKDNAKEESNPKPTKTSQSAQTTQTAQKAKCCDNATRRAFSDCTVCPKPTCAQTDKPTESKEVVGCLSQGGVFTNNTCYNPLAFGIPSQGDDTYAKRCEFSCGKNYIFNSKPLC